jgi:hypothetical protein
MIITIIIYIKNIIIIFILWTTLYTDRCGQEFKSSYNILGSWIQILAQRHILTESVHGFPQSMVANARSALQIRPLLLLSASFLIYYPLIIVSFDSTCFMLLIKVKLSLQQAVKAQRAVRRRGSNIF